MNSEPLGRTDKKWRWQQYLLLFGLNVLLAYPLAYVTYKHNDLVLTPFDHDHYLAMAERVFDNTVQSPFKYRVLTPALVHVCKLLPGYHQPIAAQLPPLRQHYHFYFTLISFLFLCAASAGLYYICRSYYGLPAFMALVGNFSCLLSFYGVAVSLAVSTDAGALFFVVLLLILHREEQYGAFMCSAVLGVMQKETVVIVLLIYLAVVSVEQRRVAWRWFAGLAPAVAVYVGMRLLMPSPGFSYYYDPHVWVQSLAQIFVPSTYSLTFISHVFVAHLPFVVALGAHGVLALRRIRVDYPMVMLLIPLGLFGVGMMLVLGNNVGRVVWFAIPWIVPYELAVVRAAVRERVEGPLAGSR